MSDNSKGVMAKDTIIYMIAKGIEGVVGIVTMSVMTYLFAAAQIGYYSTVNIAVTTVGMVAIQWLVQSVLRYINKYDIAGRQEEFYSTVFTAWLKVNVTVGGAAVLVLLFLMFGIGRLEAVQSFTSVYNYRVFVCGILWFVTYNTSQLMISMLAAVREAKLNLLLSMITVCGRLMFMVVFCKLWASKIEWIFLSYFVTDAIVSFIGMKRLKILSYLKGKPDKGILKELRDYGMPLMGNQLATSVLNKSDIYIITIALGASAAGIYQTNYSLIATAFTLLNASVMRGCYPTILRAWSEGKKNDVQRLLNEAVRMYMLVAIPAVAGVLAVSDSAAFALFESEYVEGHVVMFWVALGMMFLGLTEYSIKHWELNADTNAIFKRSLIGGAVNVGLNLILVKLTGSYFIAAVTTFIGFFVYFVLARYGTRNYLKWTIKPRKLVNILVSAFTMVVVIEILKRMLPNSKLCLALFIICGIIVYGAMLVLTGEIREELALIKKKLKKQ
ncbi:MAG: lipopolysaccharide biosynthesis protein [Clostridia bacterium]|nr:lipopolysaccharide biosynthesis protein [Clostridia bacterium]